jgi:hypothetical protein
MFFKTSGVNSKDVDNKNVNNKDVSNKDVSNIKNYNKRSSVLLVFLI